MDQREFNKILSAIKRTFSRSPLRKSVLEEVLSKKKGPRGGKMYTCSACSTPFPTRKVQVDHIEPVIPLNKAALSMSWDEIISRLYCSSDNLQVLCESCHKKKSKQEMAKRKKFRNDSKGKGRTNTRRLPTTASKRRESKSSDSSDEGD